MTTIMAAGVTAAGVFGLLPVLAAHVVSLFVHGPGMGLVAAATPKNRQVLTTTEPQQTDGRVE